MLVIFVLALMLFGGKRLPDLAKGLGKSIREFKRAASGVEDEIRRAMDLDHAPHRRPPVRRPRPTTPIGDAADSAAAGAAYSSETEEDPYDFDEDHRHLETTSTDDSPVDEAFEAGEDSGSETFDSDSPVSGEPASENSDDNESPGGKS